MHGVGFRPFICPSNLWVWGESTSENLRAAASIMCRHIQG